MEKGRRRQGDRQEYEEAKPRSKGLRICLPPSMLVGASGWLLGCCRTPPSPPRPPPLSCLSCLRLRLCLFQIALAFGFRLVTRTPAVALQQQLLPC